MLKTKNYQEFQVLSEDGTLVKTFTGTGHRCLPGDLVDIAQDSVTLITRQQTNPLIGTIHIQSKYLFGHTGRNVPIYLFFPYDASYPPFRVGCSARDGRNKIGLVKFESWEKGETYPRGVLQQILGSAGDPEAEELALKYNYAPEWKKIHKSEKQEIHRTTIERVPLTSFTFNIDPPGCKDIDDCISIDYGENNELSLWITIADLREIVEPGSDLDTYAKNQGSTLYSPDGEAIAPMLPRWISEDLASLIPGNQRDGLSLRLDWNGKEITDASFFPTIITNNQSYTYESVYENKEICKTLTEIASYLEGAPCTDSHKWIEHLMIYYNQYVADRFINLGAGFLRKLDTVSTKRLEQKAAEYCFPYEGAKHAGIKNTYYTHATSPIRRYADILAQRYLTCYDRVNQTILQNLNERMRKAASFQRDMCFLRAVTKSPLGSIEGTVLDWKEVKGEWKLYVEVPEWKQIITFRMKGYQEGENLVLQSADETEFFQVSRDGSARVNYYCDRAQPNWKKRMVFSLAN